MEKGDRIMAVSSICPDKSAAGQVFFIVEEYEYFYRCISLRGWYECFLKDDIKHNRGARRA